MAFAPIWTDIIDDPNWKILDLPPEVFRFWALCLLAAQKHDFVEGYLPDERTLAAWIRMSRDELVTCRDKAVKCHVLDVTEDGRYKVHGWERWRVAKDPGAASRKRAERLRKKGVKAETAGMSRNGHGDVTVMSAHVTPQLASNSIQLATNNTHKEPPAGGGCVGEDLEPFDPGGPTEPLPVTSRLPPDKQRVLERQTQRWGASNGDRVVGDLLADYSAEVVTAACDWHYTRNKGVLDPNRLTGICQAMHAGTWEIRKTSGGTVPYRPRPIEATPAPKARDPGPKISAAEAMRILTGKQRSQPS